MAADTIETARLTLRPLVDADAQAIVTGIGNYDVVRWLSAPPYPYGPEDAEAFLNSAMAAPGLCWAIDDGALRGVISAKSELGYWLARKAWGRGYVTEAGDAVLDEWFSDRHAGSIQSSAYQGNDRSLGVLRKLGFVETGMGTRESAALRQTVSCHEMELTRARWRARRRFRLMTPRLTLRELRLGDLPALRGIGGDSRVARNLFSVQSPWSEDVARRWLMSSLYRGRPGFRAAICRKGRLIGTVGMGAAPDNGPMTSMFMLDPDHWGQGLMTEAAGAFLAETMDRFGVPTIWADHFLDNPASGAVLRKLGFIETHRGTGTSAARVDAAPVVVYRLDRANLKVIR